MAAISRGRPPISNPIKESKKRLRDNPEKQIRIVPIKSKIIGMLFGISRFRKSVTAAIPTNNTKAASEKSNPSISAPSLHSSIFIKGHKKTDTEKSVSVPLRIIDPTLFIFFDAISITRLEYHSSPILVPF
jgi:hypothetical protein